jgi:uncharacterized membrane protein YbhN (UPF0104 family)
VSFGLAYWVLMLLWLIFGCVVLRPYSTNYRMGGFGLLLYVLLVFLGWHCFGPPIHPN